LNSLTKCRACLDLKIAEPGNLKPEPKPYVHFDVEGRWRPKRVDVLFVAESPPCNSRHSYFYNPDPCRKTGLRKEVLPRLKLDSLESFKDSGFFLIDTIKCRLCKEKGGRISKKILYGIAETCSQRFLLKEIQQLKPNTIFVLGNTARYALSQVAQFEELARHRVTESFSTNLSDYHVILCPFPGGLTRQHTRKIDLAFEKIRH